MNVVGISYTSSPISEYIGSQIYKLLGFDTHETILDYNSLKNDYNENIERGCWEINHLISQQPLLF